jgi:hypothetical protein
MIRKVRGDYSTKRYKTLNQYRISICQYVVIKKVSYLVNYNMKNRSRFILEINENFLKLFYK